MAQLRFKPDYWSRFWCARPTDGWSCVLSVVFINEGPPDRWSLVRLTDGPWSAWPMVHTVQYWLF